MIYAIIALILIAAFCAYMDRRRKRPEIPDYEIALTGDRRTADVSNVVDIFGAQHSGGTIRP